MRIMTSNIWGDYFNNSPIGRDVNLFSVYQKYAPDVIGFQEVTKAWYKSTLFEKLSDEYYMVNAANPKVNNFVPMAIKKEYALLASGFEYLEETPDDSKAITWAVVEKEGVKVALCNTHFWWMRGRESDEVKKLKNVLDFTAEDHCNLRKKNALQLTRLMTRLAAEFSCAAFAFGDMNATTRESIFTVYKQNGVQYLFDIALEKDTACSIHGDPIQLEDGTFQGKKADQEYFARFAHAMCLPELAYGEGNDRSIDHIIGWGENFSVTEYRVIEDKAALDATDHSPVYADIAFR